MFLYSKLHSSNQTNIQKIIYTISGIFKSVTDVLGVLYAQGKALAFKDGSNRKKMRDERGEASCFQKYGNYQTEPDPVVWLGYMECRRGL